MTSNKTLFFSAQSVLLLLCTLMFFPSFASAQNCLSISPSVGYQGDQNLELTITGLNTTFIQNISTVSFDNNSSIIQLLSDPVVDSPTQLRVTINIPDNATIGRTSVTVTTGPEIITCNDDNATQNSFEVRQWVTAGVGYSAGLPGATNVSIPITLDNPDGPVGAVQMEICSDPGNLLSFSSPVVCGTTARTNGFFCSTSTSVDNPLIPANCLRMILADFSGGVIDPGQGAIATFDYDVSIIAPQGQCIDPSLQIMNNSYLKIGNANTNSLKVSIGTAQFCFNDAPSCLGVSPGQGMQGDQGMQVVITGQYTNFAQGVTQVSFQNPGITVTNTTVNSPTQVTATISILESAVQGLGDVTVTTGAEQITCTNGFEVTLKVVSCQGVTPGQGFQGDQGLQVVVTGQNTNFQQSVTMVSFQNPGITVTNTVVNSLTQVTVTVDIDLFASTGPGDVTVTTGTEQVVCASGFNVLELIEACLGASPGQANQGDQNLQVVITGVNTHFAQDVTAVSFQNPGITVVSTMVDLLTQVTVIVDIAEDAYIGTGDITITTGQEVVVCNNRFAVQEKLFEITNLRVSNPTSASFSVSWTTDGNSNSRVNYSTSPVLLDYQTAFDERGGTFLDDTHLVSIGGLEPATTYYYEVISGGTIDNNGGLYYSFTTMNIPADPSPSCVVYGWAYQEDGTTPGEGAIVYLKISHGPEESYWISTLADLNGVWVLNLGNLFGTLTDDALAYSSGDPLFLEIQGGSGRVFSGQYMVAATCPLNIGSITMERFIAIDITLSTGYNLIAFPFDNMTDQNFNTISFTAYDLIGAVTECSQAYSWDPAAQSWLSALDTGNSTYFGDNFPVEAGKGYFLKCDNNTTGVFYGKELAYPLPLTFEPGFNLISVPYPPEFYTSCSLMGAVPGAGRAFSWDSYFQMWLSSLVIPGVSCIGDDFAIERKKGYFLHTTSQSGGWVPGADVVSCLIDSDCNDNNTCTDDTCIGNICQFSNNSSTCNDGLFCTDNDTCTGGICSGTTIDCSAFADQCNDGVCDDVIDQCVAQPKPNGSICSDGLFCTDNDICTGGVCIAGPARDCSGAGDQCNLGVCDDVTDQCVAQPVDNGTACSDGLFCTDNDTCTGGLCTPGPALDCSAAGDQCNLGVCDDVTDQCVAQPVDNGTACEDGFFCTDNDTCTGGVCYFGVLRDCSAAGDQCNDGVCDEGLGQCVAQQKANGTICSDGLFCTDNDTCAGGVCSGPARDCSAAGDQCNNGVCDDVADQCVAQPRPNGTICSDGLFCTDNDTCAGGVCSGPARDCSVAGDQCNFGVCDDLIDQCTAQPMDNGTICDDGLFCTDNDTCLGGQCFGRSDPCFDNATYCDGVEFCTEDNASYICSSTGDPCSLLTCDEFGGVCTGSDVTITVADAVGYFGTIDILLDNPANLVGALSLDLCDIDNRTWLHMASDNCTTTSRSSAFTCTATALGGGCVNVDLTAASGWIGIGTGAVASLNYTLDANAPLTDYADINPEFINVQDDNATSLSVTPQPGTVRAVP